MKKRENYVEYFQTAKGIGQGLYPHDSQLSSQSCPETNTTAVSYSIPETKTAHGTAYTDITLPSVLSWCNDDLPLDVGTTTYDTSKATSFNGNLSGPPNPKTKIAPVVKPPSHDLTYWRDNNLITHSAINSENRQQDKYLSGYTVSTLCGSTTPNQKFIQDDLRVQPGLIGGGIPPYTEMYTPQGSGPNCSTCSYPEPIAPGSEGTIQAPKIAEVVSHVYRPEKGQIKEGYQQKDNDCSTCSYPEPLAPGSEGTIQAPKIAEVVPHIYRPGKGQVVEDFQYPKTTDLHPVEVKHNEPGWVNTMCGYNPSQVENNLPSNLAVPNCQQSDRLSQFNKNLHTQIVTPGVYTQNQINNPLNANIGISFQQQFEPVSCERDNKGLQYTLHDPRIVEPVKNVPPRMPTPNNANTFDPRFYGYGTSYRSYTDPMLGQTKFMYDDVNAVRMPNYITRSKVDFLPYADTYDSRKPGEEAGNPNTPHIRSLVQDSWLRNSLEFRNDLSERRMRKINSEAWRRREAPLGPHLT